MKKVLFLALSLLCMSFMSEAKTIWDVRDSGKTIYLVTSLTNTPTVITTKRINKTGTQVNTQNNYLYIIDEKGTIYPINFGGDSIIIGGNAPAGANVAAKLAAASALVNYMIGHLYTDYESKVTTVALIKAGRGTLYGISIDSVGVGGLGTCTIWDGNATSDTTTARSKLFSGTITSLRDIPKNVGYTRGLVIKQKTTTAGRVHVVYNLVGLPERMVYIAPYRTQVLYCTY